MLFHPQVSDQLTINSATYRVAEHPAAPGMPYGQEGRAATVYKLVARDMDFLSFPTRPSKGGDR